MPNINFEKGVLLQQSPRRPRHRDGSHFLVGAGLGLGGIPTMNDYAVCLINRID